MIINNKQSILNLIGIVLFVYHWKTQPDPGKK